MDLDAYIHTHTQTYEFLLLLQTEKHSSTEIMDLDAKPKGTWHTSGAGAEAGMYVCMYVCI